MSEKTTTQSVTTQLPNPSKRPSLRSIDTDVDRLIEDVFADVDRALDHSAGLPNEPALPKTVSLNPLQIPPIVLRPLVMPHHQAKDLKDKDDNEETVTVKATPSDEDRLGQLFDRFLVGTACVSLALISGLWLWSRPEVKKFVTTAILGEKVAPTTPVAQVASPSAADIAFIEYINRSLERIDPKLASNGITTSPTNLPTAQNPSVPPLPILSIPFNPAAPDAMAQSLSRIATALEKFSVTSLRPPQPSNANNPIRPTTASSSPSPSPAAASPSPRPSAASPRTRPAAASPSPSPAAASPSPSPAAASPQASAAAPSPAEVATAPEPELEAPMAVVPAPQPEIPSKPTLAPFREASPEAEALPMNIHTLLGILQFGDRSAALFEVNGVPSRVNIGESIGSSGWTLVEVTEQQARIRRNGEVQDIFVGQQF